MAGLTNTSPTRAPAAVSKTLPPALQKAVSGVGEINSLPDVTARIVAVVEDERSTARQVQAVVESDPALAAKLLKVVNSAFYGLPSQVASLERAILMLGLSVVKNLALASAMGQLLKPGPICGEFQTGDLWRHCVAVGVAARMLAVTAKSTQPDEAFVAGLVHDIGLIIAQQLFPNQVRSVSEQCLREPQNFCAAEETELGADHQAFGGLLATKWKFPPALRNAIAYHHEPSSLQPEYQKLTSLVYLADTLCCRHQFGFWLTAQTQETPEWMFELTRVQPAHLDEVAELLPERVAEAETIFS